MSEEHHDRIRELEKLVYVPGLWKCPKCNFQLMQASLNANNGSVTSMDKPGEKCPNCDSPLWRVTERQAGNDMVDRCEEQMNRAVAAEKALAEKERELADLIARYYHQEIGCLMQQAEHWAKENFPLAVHHRVRKADAYYQVVALFERFAAGQGNPFDAMRDALDRGLVKAPGAYPPTAEIDAYRDPRFVVQKLKTASKAAGGPL